MTIKEFIMRILLAIFLGFLIGAERQITGHRAGIRINILISLGACLFMLFPMLFISQEMYRIASYIISGVSFLCSGVIFKGDGSVKGLNTAATLWCTSAIGVLASSGLYLYAAVATMILIISNLIFRPISMLIPVFFTTEDNEINYIISVTCLEEKEIIIRSLIVNNIFEDMYLLNLESGDVIGDRVEIKGEFILIEKRKKQTREKIESLVTKLLKSPGVISAGWEIK